MDSSAYLSDSQLQLTPSLTYLGSILGSNKDKRGSHGSSQLFSYNYLVTRRIHSHLLHPASCLQFPELNIFIAKMGFSFNAKDSSAPREVYNWQLFWVILVAAGGSVIFGYDLAFIGGVFSLESFIRRFELANKDASAIQAHMVNTCKLHSSSGRISLGQGRLISLLT